MKVPKFLQSTLWSYDLTRMDNGKAKNLIITQVLNHGTWEQLLWLLKNYSLKDIKSVLRKPQRGVWQKETLNYWSKILDIKTKNNKKFKAFFTLDVK